MNKELVKDFMGDTYKQALARVIKFIDEYNLKLTYMEIKCIDNSYVANIKYQLGLR